jgi:hypothetical protein
VNADELREHEYVKRMEVNALRVEAFARPADTPPEVLNELRVAEEALAALTALRVKAESNARGDAARPGTFEVRGPRTTGLSARLEVCLPAVSTAIYHALDPETEPLLRCYLRKAGSAPFARLRVTSFIEGYSARAVETVELEGAEEKAVVQSPPLFGDRIRGLTEMTGAAVNVLVENLDKAVEIHRTVPIRLLPRTTVPLTAVDPASGLIRDLSRYLGAFVTPNAPAVLGFLHHIAEQHPDRRLIGFQDGPEAVEPQVKAVYNALAQRNMRYVVSVQALGPGDGVTVQRVRLPSETLADDTFGCVDATVLMASLLEAMSLSPALVVLPGHVLLGWETWRLSDTWRYVETTSIGSASFEDACAAGERLVANHRQVNADQADPFHLRRWPLRTLRIHGAGRAITPLE